MKNIKLLLLFSVYTCTVIPAGSSLPAERQTPQMARKIVYGALTVANAAFALLALGTLSVSSDQSEKIGCCMILALFGGNGAVLADASYNLHKQEAAARKNIIVDLCQ